MYINAISTLKQLWLVVNTIQKCYNNSIKLSDNKGGVHLTEKNGIKHRLMAMSIVLCLTAIPYLTVNATAEQPAPEATEEMQEEAPEEAQNIVVRQEDGQYQLTVSANAKLRVEPTTNSRSKVTIPFGITIVADSRVTNNTGELWYHVSYGGSSGYVRSDMVNEASVAQQESNEEVTVEESAEGENVEGEASQETSETTVNTLPPDEFMEESAIATESEAEAVDETSDTTATAKKNFRLDIVFILFMVVGSILICVSAFVFGKFRGTSDTLRKQMKEKLNQ